MAKGWVEVANTMDRQAEVSVPRGETLFRVSGLCANGDEVWGNQGIWIKRGTLEVTR